MQRRASHSRDSSLEPMPMFYDRFDAGQRLASHLTKKYSRHSPIVVCALANGGIPVGLEIAAAFKTPLVPIVSPTITHPLQPLFAVCAITEDGERMCDEHGVCGLDTSWIENETEHQIRLAAAQRNALDAHIPDLSGKTVILADDGMVTGLPMRAAIKSVRNYNPDRIIVAVPSAPYEIRDKIMPLVDGVEILVLDKQYRGVTRAYYTHFPRISDTEAKQLLKTVPTHHSSLPTHIRA